MATKFVLVTMRADGELFLHGEHIGHLECDEEAEVPVPLPAVVAEGNVPNSLEEWFRGDDAA